MLIEFNDCDLDSIKNIIDKVFGIHTYHIAYVCDSELESIKECVLDVARNSKFSTFKVETKRSNKKFSVHSGELNNILGGLILKNVSGCSVDVHNPDMLLKVEIRDENTYVYHESFKGCGGYPVGTQPKGLLMLSGGMIHQLVVIWQ